MRKIVIWLIVLFPCLEGTAQIQYSNFTKINEDDLPRRGIVLDNGREIIPASYKYIFHTNDHFFVYNDSNWGWYNHEGLLIMEPSFTDVGYGVIDSMLRVKKEGKWGYIDIYGNVKIPFRYDFACNFEAGLAYVILEGQPGFINPKGEWLTETFKVKQYCPEDAEAAEEIPNSFDGSSTHFIISRDSLYGVADSLGKSIIPTVYDEIGYYYNGIIHVKKNGKWGAYKENGTLICEPKYHSLWLFHQL